MKMAALGRPRRDVSIDASHGVCALLVVENMSGENFARGLGLACVEGGSCLFVACLSHLTIDHASLARRSTILTPNMRPPTFGHS